MTQENIQDSGVNFNVKLIKDFQCRLDALEG